MKRKIILLLLLGTITTFLHAKSDTIFHRLPNSQLNQIIGLNEDFLLRIPPPLEMYSKSIKVEKITVNYHDFPYPAQVAFQYAVDIWSSIFVLDRPVTVDAYWKALGTGTLGSCGPSNYFANYDGMPNSRTFYPIALAEKMAQKDLNEGEADILANFNNTTNWYYDTDGKTPSGQYDLVTVVLHELCHGLGFTGSFNVSGTIGSWGWGNNYPFAFDRFLKDISAKQLTDTLFYPNNSGALKTALTRQVVYFDSPILVKEYGNKVAMYIPSPWNSGSSLYHLNTLYAHGIHGLMTPFISTETSIHDPGIIAKSILEDLGWKHINIEHKAQKNVEEIKNIAIEASIHANYVTDIVSPKLFYSLDSAEYVPVTMVPETSQTGKYSAVLPISKETNVSYYITVEDKYARKFKVPVTSPENNYSFYVGKDTIPPEISHFPTYYLLEGQDTIHVDARVEDNLGVDTVFIEYAINTKEKIKLGMNRLEDNKFVADINLSKMGVKIGDSILYRIVAKDRAKTSNQSYYPKEGYAKVFVEAIPEFVNNLDLKFETTGSEFILQGFQIGVPNGFDTGTLNTNHPYEFAGDNSTLNYIAQIRYPIKIADKSPFISFDEIVLVEPGEPGTKYGDEEFWDYVIVEGSKNQGKTWIPFEPGWDCRKDAQWELTYNQSIVNQYSQAIGDPSLYRNHVIDMTASGDFKPGETVLVRFRLFSDPFAYGWGWAIDNLKIQTESFSSHTLLPFNGLSVYPNPVTNRKLNFHSSKPIQNMEVVLFDLQGNRISGYSNVSSNGCIELPAKLRGAYILVVRNKTESVHFKLLIE